MSSSDTKPGSIAASTARGAAQRLSAEHRRFLWIDQGLISVLFNFALNASIAWLSVYSLVSMPLWGNQSIAVDTFATAFLLPLFTALIVTRLVRRQVATARLSPLPSERSSPSPWVARSGLGRGIRLGFAGMLLAALPLVVILALFGLESLERTRFIWFKAGFAALLAGAVTPFIGWWALLESSARQN